MHCLPLLMFTIVITTNMNHTSHLGPTAGAPYWRRIIWNSIRMMTFADLSQSHCSIWVMWQVNDLCPWLCGAVSDPRKNSFHTKYKSSDNFIGYSISSLKSKVKEGGLTRNGSYHPWIHGPLVRYVKLPVAHAPGMPGTYSIPPTSKEAAS